MWALFAICCAFFQASFDACAKRALAAGNGTAVVLAVRYVVAVAVLAPLPWLTAAPRLDRTFWLLHIPWLPLEAIAVLLTMRAIRVSPLSLTLPFVAFTPIFLVLVEGVLFGRWAGPQGALGTVVIVVGSYLLNLGAAARDLLGPFKAILREPGSRMMLAVALIYTITALFGKELTDRTTAPYFAWHYAVALTLVFTPLYLPALRGQVPSRWHWSLWLGGVMFAAMAATHMAALAAGSHVAYVIALKRLSGAFGVLYGRTWFGEREWRMRLVGSLIMAAGSLLILLEQR